MFFVSVLFETDWEKGYAGGLAVSAADVLHIGPLVLAERLVR